MLLSELPEIPELWASQYAHNPLLRQYASLLGTTEPVSLPIAFFKEAEVKTGQWIPQAIFESSRTSGQTPSQHFVRDLSLYDQNVLEGFFHFFPEKNYRILALLPSYLERSGSSLVHMVKVWMDHFGLPGSGFYLRDFDALRQAIFEAGEAGEDILLIGVSFALLDFAESQPITLPPGAIVMETGGMKGRREELIRSQLHERLCKGLGVDTIASEYGMTELLSQAYALENGRFRPSPTLEVRVSDLHLNRLTLAPGITGRLHFIDRANLHSCAFIATDDLGRIHEDGSFEVLGRIDYAELRGCNLMY